jgi:hypothetical protein
MNEKPWYLSKTFWLNLLTALGAVLAAVAGSDLIAEYPKAAAIVAAGIAGVNIALRFVTVLPLEGMK